MTHPPDLLAFTSFPKAHWKQIWSNNPHEPLSEGNRRRTDVVGIFPNREAVIRLVGAVLAEEHDEWTVARRYLTLDSLSRTQQLTGMRPPPVRHSTGGDRKATTARPSPPSPKRPSLGHRTPLSSRAVLGSPGSAFSRPHRRLLGDGVAPPGLGDLSHPRSAFVTRTQGSQEENAPIGAATDHAYANGSPGSDP